jgi:DNA polymerase-3 subunit epsilon
MREIVLDTETTGFDPKSGDRIVEIGCVELINLIPTGRVFHRYINPQRNVPKGAVDVHGLTEEFLKDHPIFLYVVDEFLAFIGESPLVIHNAAFDMRFLNAELTRLCRTTLPMARAIDTLAIAREKFPGSPATLDALCRRFKIDLSLREKHGALLDAELLAEVYLELKGGRQAQLGLTTGMVQGMKQEGRIFEKIRTFREPRAFPISTTELEAHQAYLKGINEPLWLRLAENKEE